ncbi:MAG: glycosyltransferase [Sedimentisphaerales bacterium]|nr:glycosyltransferase [Sedimentisphaerales bacterium]
MRVLYITHNGLADHIGQSQVLPYLLGLANEGFAITVVSAEKSTKISFRKDITEQLKSADIDWHIVTYHNKPPLISTVFDLFRMYWISQRIVRRSDIRLIHGRSFFPVFIGLLIKQRFNIPLIFDFRDFWADRGMFSKPFKFVYRFFKGREGWMIRNSEHIVTLTEKAKSILHQAYLHDHEQPLDERFTVIPTCVDVDLFDTRGISDADRLAVREVLGIDDSNLVFGYLGTFHTDYIPAEMFRAFRILRSLEPNAKFLFVSPSTREEIIRYAEACGVDETDIRVVSADRADVPKYLSVFDLSVVFIRPDASTAGVSPSKLAELFACNIPVLASAGVGDLDAIVRPEINDSVLVHDFSDESLKKAITQLLDIVRSQVRNGRAASMQFSLAEGVRRYGTVYSRFVRPVRSSCPSAEGK